MIQKILKTGNSLCLTIPSRFVKILGLKPGHQVHTRMDIGRNQLTHKFTGSGQLPLPVQK